MSDTNDPNKHMKDIARVLNTFSHDERKGIIFHAAHASVNTESTDVIALKQRDVGLDVVAQFVLEHRDDIDHMATHFVELFILTLASEEFRRLIARP